MFVRREYRECPPPLAACKLFGRIGVKYKRKMNRRPGEKDT